MIGSVEFAKPGSTEMQQDMDAGVLSNPALSSVLGSERGKALLASQVSSQYLRRNAITCLSRYLSCIIAQHTS